MIISIVLAFLCIRLYPLIPLATVEAISSKPLQSPQHKIYLDVKPVNTTWHLEVLRALNITNYRLSYEIDSNRVRIGAIGPQLPQLIPDAVDLVAKRVIPPVEKGGQPTTLYNVPVVDDNTLFMYGIGATKELAKNLETLEDALAQQVDRVVKLYGETTKLEKILSKSSEKDAELRMRAAEAEASKALTEVEISIQRTKNEEEYIKMQENVELLDIRRNEKLTLERLQKEDAAARIRAKEAMRLSFETSQQMEHSRIIAGEILSAAQHERDIALQRSTEEIKAKTAKVRQYISCSFDAKFSFFRILRSSLNVLCF